MTKTKTARLAFFVTLFAACTSESTPDDAVMMDAGTSDVADTTQDADSEADGGNAADGADMATQPFTLPVGWRYCDATEPDRSPAGNSCDRSGANITCVYGVDICLEVRDDPRDAPDDLCGIQCRCVATEFELGEMACTGEFFNIGPPRE